MTVVGFGGEESGVQVTYRERDGLVVLSGWYDGGYGQLGQHAVALAALLAHLQVTPEKLREIAAAIEAGTAIIERPVQPIAEPNLEWWAAQLEKEVE